jgi:hypothetical protein
LSLFFLNKYNDGHSSIHFIQNLMLNSNLKSDFQKIFKLSVYRPKHGQTEFDWPSANTNYHLKKEKILIQNGTT